MQIFTHRFAKIGDFGGRGANLGGVALELFIRSADQGEVALIGNGENDAAVAVLENESPVVRKKPPDDHVTALDQPYASDLVGPGQTEHLSHPGTGGVDQVVRRDPARLSLGVHKGRGPGLWVPLQGCDLGAGENLGAAFGRVQRIQDHKASVIDPGVGIFKAEAKISAKPLAQRRA